MGIILVISNPPGEYKCCICRKFYSEDDIKFVGHDPVCFDCYKKAIDKSKDNGKCNICNSPLSSSERGQCYSCRAASYRERENNLLGGDIN